MRRFTLAVTVPLAALTLLGACSSGTSGVLKPSATTAAGATQTTTAGTQAPTGGKADCTAVKNAMLGLIVNWQVVLQLPASPASEWASNPLGSIAKFGEELGTLQAAVGADADAAASLKFMKGADDIVARGMGGDAKAQADLGAYLGTDLTGNISKQVPIAKAESALGCV